MKYFAYLFISLSVLFIASCTGEHHHEENEEKAADHGDEIVISPEQAAKLGIKVDTVQFAPINDVIKVTGEIIADPSNQGVIVAYSPGKVTLSSSAKEGVRISKGAKIASISGAEFTGGDPNRIARIQRDAAKRELDRLKPLRDEGIVTAAEYNAAERAYLEAVNAIGTGADCALAPISGIITSVDVANGQYVEAGTPIATIVADGKLTVRVDVPKRYAAAAHSARSAKIKLPYSDTTVDASLASAPSNAIANSAFLPVYFSIPSSKDLLPGSFVEAYLNVGAGKTGIRVPDSCITERLGQKFVYVKVDDEGYERVPVVLGASDGQYTEIVSGLSEGDVVVTDGATFVRLAESSSAIPHGHSHSH